MRNYFDDEMNHLKDNCLKAFILRDQKDPEACLNYLFGAKGILFV